jgi:hypothetical protein
VGIEAVEIVEAGEEAGEEAEEEVAGAIMDLGGAAVVSEAIEAEVEDVVVEEEGMEGRLAVVNKLSRSFRKDLVEQSCGCTKC